MHKPATIIGVALLITLCGRPVSANPDSSWVTGEYHQGDFKLVSTGHVTDILIAPDDFKVVRLAADDLAMDVERVTGQKPSVNVEAGIGSAFPGLVSKRFERNYHRRFHAPGQHSGRARLEDLHD